MKHLFIKYQPFLYGFLLAFITIVGAVWYSVHHDIFIVLPYQKTYSKVEKSTAVKKTVTIYIWKNDTQQQESVEVLWEMDTESQIHAIAQAWLNLLEQETLINEKINVQDVCSSITKNNTIISFSSSPLPKDASLHTKLKLIETLIKTIQSTVSINTPIHVFVQHKPIIDTHIDGTNAWPLEGYTTHIQPRKQARSYIQNNQYHPLTILIDPAGDARIPGRTIQDTFERGITLIFAQKIKTYLEENNPYIRVILSRFPDESIEGLQTAAFANRLNADLFCAFSFYQQTTPVISIDPYFFVYHPTTDFWLKPPTHHELIPYNKAYICSLQKTALFASNFTYQLAHHDKAVHYIVHDACGAPIRTLVGIKTIALYTEIGISNKEDWVHCIEPIGDAILALINAKE